MTEQEALDKLDKTVIGDLEWKIALTNALTKQMMIDKTIIAESIAHYGKEIQTTVCMEECAELIQAISKQKRGKGLEIHLCEEIADVLICIEILKQVYTIHDFDLEMMIRAKQDRILKRIRGDEDAE